MAGIFIAGNGFDIAHGIPTKYSEFRKYIISRYPDALKFRDAKISMEELEYVPTEEFAAEILLSTMDKVSGIDWMNFEAELAHIDFSRKFPIPNHKENETEEENNYLMRNYLLYMDSLTDEFIISAEYWWEIFLEDWIKEVQISIKINNYDRKKDLAELFKKEELMFFSFNYTKTLEKLYGIKEVTHIHNYMGEKLVLGHGEEEIGYEGEEEGVMSSFGSSFLDDMIMYFKKDTDFQMIKHKKFFKKLNREINKVYSYGFSYGKVDAVYIKRIINNISSNATWYFTKYEAENSEELRIKKVKLRNYGFKGSFGIY